jgi:hypothetical protein
MDSSRRVTELTGMEWLTQWNPNRARVLPIGSDIGSDKELIRASHRPIVGQNSSDVCDWIVRPHHR